MKRRYKRNLFLMVILAAFFLELAITKVEEQSKLQRLTGLTTESMAFREQNFTEEMLTHLQNADDKGMAAGIYLLESKFGYQEFSYSYTKETFQKLKRKWQKSADFSKYIKMMQAIWNDIKYFPVPESITDSQALVYYEESWMTERTYGGKRGHEGTDIMAKKNERGLYPVVSITDGVVQNKGWLEKGGYRIGILSPSGGYFYYAHLDSYANLEEGDEVKAGDILGFMGDSGYGEEGTVGQFPVHLHLGIYIYPDGKEVSVNPYWILRYLEGNKLKCAY